MPAEYQPYTGDDDKYPGGDPFKGVPPIRQIPAVGDAGTSTGIRQVPAVGQAPSSPGIIRIPAIGPTGSDPSLRAQQTPAQAAEQRRQDMIAKSLAQAPKGERLDLVDKMSRHYELAEGRGRLPGQQTKPLAPKSKTVGGTAAEKQAGAIAKLKGYLGGGAGASRAPVRLGRMSDAPYRALAKEAGDAQADAEIISADSAAKLERASKVKQDALINLAKMQADTAEKVSDEKYKAVKHVMDSQEKIAAIRNDQLAQQQAWEGKIEKARQYERYALMPPEEVDHHLSVVNDPEATDDMKAASQMALKKGSEIDPSRRYKTWQRVLLAIAAGMSRFGSLLAGKGGPNPVLQMIQKGLDQELALQKGEFAKAKQRTGGTVNDYDRNMKAYNDQVMAELATRKGYLDNVALTIDAHAAANKSPEALEQAQVQKAQIQEQQAKLQEQINIRSQALMAQGRRERFGYERAKEGVSRQNQAIAGREAALNSRAAAGSGGGVLDVPGLQRTKDVSKDDAKKVKEMFSNYRVVRQKIRRLIELRKKYGSEHLPTAAKAEMDQLGGDIMNENRKLSGSGAALTGNEVKWMDPGGSFQNPAGIGFKLEPMKAYLRGLDQRMPQMLNTYGYRQKAPYRAKGAKKEGK